MTPTTPGTFIYTDPIGSPPERIEVVRDGDVLAARFQDAEADPELIPVDCMAGEFRPA